MKKLKLNDLEIDSFTTALTKQEKQTVNGAMGTFVCYDPKHSNACAPSTRLMIDCSRAYEHLNGREPKDTPAEEPNPKPIDNHDGDNVIPMIVGSVIIGGAAVALTIAGGGATCLFGGAVGGGLATAH